jgi:hypothetical protein
LVVCYTGGNSEEQRHQMKVEKKNEKVSLGSASEDC